MAHDEDPSGAYSFRESFRGEVWEDAEFRRSHLPDTDFTNARMTQVRFISACLRGSVLAGAHFLECDFSAADLSFCTMRGAVFDHCRFVAALLRGADLRDSSFLGCEFVGAILEGAIADSEVMNALGDRLAEDQIASMTLAEDWAPEAESGNGAGA